VDDCVFCTSYCAVITQGSHAEAGEYTLASYQPRAGGRTLHSHRNDGMKRKKRLSRDGRQRDIRRHGETAGDNTSSGCMCELKIERCVLAARLRYSRFAAAAAAAAACCSGQLSGYRQRHRSSTAFYRSAIHSFASVVEPML